ncbi:GNAT family N-acetyltransferase [Piscibacillus halophilus]|uniref:Acetyltransferase (GNAT) family protein n=1 Tax=Piscibacillus halophilus TaxID=571933 RepID=A0A1H8YUH3_9BACI|nr:GNAT family N-acetyltransferase [Piscibacillus halophilus]SEP55691.1 Acetyltransferase (GNAT) family protein [Piscibacillus halophilus]
MREIQYKFFNHDDTDLENIGKLYCKTFIRTHFTGEDLKSVIQNISKHSTYKGFVGLKAKSNQGHIIGFTYGYTSLPDQFYRQKIEAQLSGVELKYWLEDCFEFVELAVDIKYRRKGIAKLLHDQLLNSVVHTTSLLTTSIDNYPAIQFYRRNNWEVIKNNAAVITDQNLQVIMGKKLKWNPENGGKSDGY